MQKVTIETLVPCSEYRDALGKPRQAEIDGLRSLIKETGQFLMPVLYHIDNLGACLIVDGYTRYDIWLEDKEAFEKPPVREVMCLSGATEEEVVDWIKRHQAFRRNNEKLILQYEIGKRSLEVGATKAAEDAGVTVSKARHAQELARAVEECEDLEPGIKEDILASGVKAAVVKEAAATKDTSRLRTAIDSPTGSTPRGSSAPKGTMALFKKVNTELSRASRTIRELENETTANEWSQEIASLMNKLLNTLEEWENAEILGS